MKTKILSLSLATMVAAPLLVSASELTSASEDVGGFIVISKKPSTSVHANVTRAPQQLTAKQVEELRFSGQTNLGAYALRPLSKQGYEAAMPSAWQIISGTYPRVAGRTNLSGISVLPAQNPSESGEFKDHISYVYEFGGAYTSARMPVAFVSTQPLNSNNHLNPEKDVLYVDFLAPILGDKDFINVPGKVPYCKEMRFKDVIVHLGTEFIEQTKGRCEYRLNSAIMQMLLMIAQQEGEDIQGLSSSARDARGKELFAILLGKCKLKLDSLQDSLGINVYKRVIPAMASHIFKNAGIDPNYLPSDLDIDREVMGAILERGQTPEEPDLQHIVPCHKAEGHQIRKIVSPHRLAQMTPVRLQTSDLEQFARSYEALLRLQQMPALLEDGQGVVGGQVNVPWLVFRHGVIDPLEREVVGQINAILAEQISMHVPGGKLICCGLVGATRVMGRKTIADMVVDTAHGWYSPAKAIQAGLKSDEAASFLDDTAGCLIGLLPGGALVYEGGRCLVTFCGYKSPAHAMLSQGASPSQEQEDCALQTTAQALRSGIKLFVPGGGLIVGGAKGVAWYLGHPSLTHYVYASLHDQKALEEKAAQ